MDDNTKNIIQNHIDNNDVCLFMKGTPDAPQCGFSMAVSNILKILEVNFTGINVLEDQSIREGVKIFSDWPTIPQLYQKRLLDTQKIIIYLKIYVSTVMSLLRIIWLNMDLVVLKSISNLIAPKSSQF